VDAYLDRRTRLSEGLSQLTTAGLYRVLTGAPLGNETGDVYSTAELRLSADQLAVLTAVMEVVQLWGVGAINCTDHWMSYLTSTFCLACDPLPSYWTQLDPHTPPFLILQQSVCTSIYSHCSSLFLDFFELLPPLLAELQRWPGLTSGYNMSAAWWSSYSSRLELVANKVSLEINIDLCADGSSKPDCSDIFCFGSVDRAEQWYPHAFRGLQYGADSRTLRFVLDAHAYIASMVCTLRLAYNASGAYEEGNYEGRSDGCPLGGNLLNLLFPRQFDLSPVLSSSCVDGSLHEPNERDVRWCLAPKWCWWKADPATADTVPPMSEAGYGSFTSFSAAPYSDSAVDELCDMNGFTFPWWLDNASLAEAWPAYAVGCQLNLSRHICQLPPLPPPPPPDVVEEVDELFHRLFVPVVGVGLSLLLCALACLCRRYRLERVERLEAREADERSGSAMELEWEEALMEGKRKQGEVAMGAQAA